MEEAYNEIKFVHWSARKCSHGKIFFHFVLQTNETPNVAVKYEGMTTMARPTKKFIYDTYKSLLVSFDHQEVYRETNRLASKGFGE